jgi:hypothetical protein
MMIIVLLRSLITFSSQRMVAMSRLLVGSSSSRMSGLENSAWPANAQLPARRDFAHRTVVLVDRNADPHQEFAGA